MKNLAPMMKILIPFLTLFLASCGVHNHRYDADQDAYYQDDYYVNDNYDPYYGYGSSGYSSAGDGVFYNDYNYYPDRWGVNYSNVNYTPYRYPRVGFYFSSGYGCGYSYWSNGCYSGFSSSNHYAYNGWSSFGLGIGYSNYYYDNNWWYNHWRHRNYEHYRPTQTGYYSARNEALRLNNNRRYNNSYKSNQPSNRYNRYSNSNRNNPMGVNRNRSSSNQPVNRSNNRPSNSNTPSRTNKPVQRGRQEALQSSQRYNQSRTNDLTRSEVLSRSNSQNLQNNRTLTQKPAPEVNNMSSRSNSVNRVKPMNSQTPIYQTNGAPRVQNRSNTVQYNQRTLNNQSQVAPRVEQNQRIDNRVIQSRSNQPQSNQPTVNPSQPTNNVKPRTREKSANKNKVKNSDDNRSSSSA